MGAKGWRQNITGEDWARSIEKRILHEERRPIIRTASDILGPGIAALATPLTDWNSDSAVFNGFYYTDSAGVNGPAGAVDYWMGFTIGAAGGFGIQKVWGYVQGDPSAPAEFYRQFVTEPPETRVYTPWVSVA